METDEILKKLDSIKDIPTLPTIVFELNELLKDPNTPITDISDIIEKDQAMSLRVLKLVNSAFYGIHKEVNDIGNAIVLLGFNTVRNAIVSLGVINSFSGIKSLEGFDISDFWKHSLAVAVVSKSLAEKTKIASPDSCFVGGLLHDIGKVILAQYFQDLFEKVWNVAKRKNISFYEAEKKEISIDHTIIGAHLATKWELPESFIDVIRWHHDVRNDTESKKMILIIYLSDIIVNSYNADPDGNIDLSVMHPAASKFLKKQLGDVDSWFAEIENDIKSSYQFFLEG
ncbi:MAG: HDOD domain-containing protein [Thermodesulfobacteriota bacterium]|nr:HDOD domain-containing protein [Thermodesulfobacteriota bacterium]